VEPAARREPQGKRQRSSEPQAMSSRAGCRTGDARPPQYRQNANAAPPVAAAESRLPQGTRLNLIAARSVKCQFGNTEARTD